MPDLKTIRADIAELPKGSPLVVALPGGTSGIGSYIAKALARTYKDAGSKLRVYIIGRNASRAEELLRFGREISAGSDWRFVQVSNLALISEVDKVCQEIIRLERNDPFAGGSPRLDVLYLTSALSPFQESEKSKEGLDSQISLLYYSRIRFIQNLTPLLTASPKQAHVISVFAGGMEDNAKPGENLVGVPPPETYGMTTTRKNVTFMKTFAFEELAEQHAGKISFIHIYPGLVDGPTFYSDVNPWYWRLFWYILKPLVSWYMTSPEVCGEVMLYLATPRYPAKGSFDSDASDQGTSKVALSSQMESGGGAYAVGQRGDENKKVSYENLRKDNTAKEVWNHTTRILDEIEKKNVAS